MEDIMVFKVKMIIKIQNQDSDAMQGDSPRFVRTSVHEYGRVLGPTRKQGGFYSSVTLTWAIPIDVQNLLPMEMCRITQSRNQFPFPAPCLTCRQIATFYYKGGNILLENASRKATPYFWTWFLFVL